MARLVAAIAGVGVRAYPQQPADPVIGIVTHPLWECTPPPPGVQANSCLESFYVDWLEAAGIRVIAIPYNSSLARHMYLAERLNGIQFPGGASMPGDYWPTAVALFNKTVEWNQAGDPFFLWGTCMGFQVICSAAANDRSVITGPYGGMEPLMMALNFTSAQPSSRLFGNATCPASLLHTLATKNSTLNWHQDVVRPEQWETHPWMKELLTPLSTNTVPSGEAVFVSSVESPIANIFATQFHPERPPYEFSNDLIGHTAGDIAVSQYLANFIAAKMRLNNHSFENATDVEALRIARFPRVDHGWGHKTYYVYDPEN